MKNYFQLEATIVDAESYGDFDVFLNTQTAKKEGVREVDSLMISTPSHQNLAVSVILTDSLVKPYQVGIPENLAERLKIKDKDTLDLELLGVPNSVKLIARRLRGEELNYPEVRQIISDLVDYRLNDSMVAFYLASTFWDTNSLDEIFFLTKAMVETGKSFDFGDKVADKHSTGGLAGNRITPIIVAIVSSFGVLMPKTSSRAVTSPAGTADTFEVLAPVVFTTQEVKELIKKNKGCVIWGAVDIASADSRIIRVAHQLPEEPIAKLVTSIMAKKVAMGSKYLLIDIPVNPTAKVKTLQEADKIKSLFLYLGKRFKVKVKVISYYSFGPVGRGIGPALEARDIVRVMQRKEERPLDLEKKGVYYAGELLEMTGRVPEGKGQEAAQKCMESGKAWKQLQKIIKAQGGNPNIDSEDVKLGEVVYDLRATKKGRIRMIENQDLGWVAKALGAPTSKRAGVYLEKLPGELVKEGDTLCYLYTTSQARLNVGLDALKNHPIYLLD
jgi:putative thymidine phosphorylase